MLQSTVSILFPLFLSVAAGFFFSRKFSLSEDTIVRILTDFSMPLLVFHSLYTARFPLRELAGLAGAASIVVLGLLVIALFYVKARRLDAKAHIPPIIFINSGFLGIPLMKLWGGTAAMNAIVIYDQVQTMYIFTVGIFIVTGGFSLRGLKEIIKSPLVWAILLGFLFSMADLSLPPFLLSSFEFAGSAAPPLAAFALGISIASKRLAISWDLLAGLLLRVAGGFAIGYLAAWLLGLEELTRTVVIVASSLPSAVFSFVLPQRYGADASYAGTMVLASTVLGIVFIPLAFYLAGGM